ncbi:T9SS type A sorting domain-containing protein [Mesonia phycicola]|nr:T9SS type A sorting domain-containing protein [Mesonia phycicola]
MKNNYYLVFIAILLSICSHSQVCNQLPLSLTQSICNEADAYFISSSVITELSIQDSNGVKQTAIWSNIQNLYIDSSCTIPYTVNTAVTEVYFLSSTSYEVYNNTATYTQTGCTQEFTTEFNLYTDGLALDILCSGTNYTVADLSFLNYTNSQINFFSDAAGTISLSSTDPVSANDTLYASFGSSCSLLPVLLGINTVTAPIVEPIQSFCNQAWIDAGITYNAASVADLEACGENLTWYQDSLGTLVVTDPSTELLVNGGVYYVSQTIGGCESSLASITVSEVNNACFENSSLESNDFTNFSFFQGASIQKTCSSPDLFSSSTSVSLSATINDTNSLVSIVTEGYDNHLLQYGYSLSRVSPLGNVCSESAIRLNDVRTSAYVGLQKDFIAGEVFKLDFAGVFQNPSGHAGIEAYYKILIENSCGDKIEECLSVDMFDCSSVVLPYASFPTSAYTPYGYIDWSQLIIDTSNFEGEAVSLQVIASSCGYSGHYSYIYLDNLYVGDSAGVNTSSSLFAYTNAEVTSTSATYNSCSSLNNNSGGLTYDCTSSSLDILNPTFPIAVTVDYELPVSSTINSSSLEIYNNGSLVGTVNPTQTTSNQLIYNINQSDLSATLYGDAEIISYLDYQSTCNAGATTVLGPAITSIVNLKSCPISGCPTDVIPCLNSNTVDLTTAESDILNGQAASNYTITYYTTETGAIDQVSTDLISNPTIYDISSITANTTLYARLEYDYTTLGISSLTDCYDVISFTLTPPVPHTFSISDINYCDSFSNSPVVDLTVNETEILMGLNANDFQIEYYENLADANSGTNSIALPNQYSLLNSNQTIYIKLNSNTNSCSYIESFQVKEHQLVNYTTSISYEVCDDDNPADGFYSFDLSLITSQINTTLQGNYQIEYYLTQADAQAQQNSLTGNYTNITAFAQTIYASISDTFVVCNTILPVDLSVISGLKPSSTPVPSNNNTAVTLSEETVNGKTEYFYIFQWTPESDLICLDNSQEEFMFNLGTSATNFNIVSEVVSTNSKKIYLDHNTDYYWQVIPLDGNNQYNGTVETWHFKSSTLNVNDFESSNFTYYNDSSKLSLDSDQFIENIQIYDLTGKKVISKNINSNNPEIDISSLSTGVYIAKILMDNNYKTIKILK